jgi:xylan 1,4-beta-xylosidase
MPNCPRRSPRFPLLACLAATLAFASLPATGTSQSVRKDDATGTTAAGRDPRFDWFEYQGRDPIDATARVGTGQYRNPILQGFYPDPSMTRVGDDYYLVTSTFAYFPGIPVFRSRDLVSWTQIGNVIDRPSQLSFDSLGMSRGVFAPTIQHKDGTFYVLNTCVDCGGNFVVTATNPAGPWSEPTWLRGIGGIDPSLFFDDDGKTYILNNDAPVGTPLYEGHRAIWIQEFDLAALRPIGPRSVIINGGVDLSTKPIWIEGPHIFKHEGKYYLSAAEGGTAEGHSQVILRADAPT